MEGWMDENFIKNVFQTVLAENVQVKVIRDRNSGFVCFLSFSSSWFTFEYILTRRGIDRPTFAVG